MPAASLGASAGAGAAGRSAAGWARRALQSGAAAGLSAAPQPAFTRPPPPHTSQQVAEPHHLLITQALHRALAREHIEPHSSLLGAPQRGGRRGAAAAFVLLHPVGHALQQQPLLQQEGLKGLHLCGILSRPLHCMQALCGNGHSAVDALQVAQPAIEALRSSGAEWRPCGCSMAQWDGPQRWRACNCVHALVVLKAAVTPSLPLCSPTTTMMRCPAAAGATRSEQGMQGRAR